MSTVDLDVDANFFIMERTNRIIASQFVCVTEDQGNLKVRAIFNLDSNEKRTVSYYRLYFLLSDTFVHNKFNDPQDLQGAATFTADITLNGGSVLMSTAWDPSWEMIARMGLLQCLDRKKGCLNLTVLPSGFVKDDTRPAGYRRTGLQARSLARRFALDHRLVEGPIDGRDPKTGFYYSTYSLSAKGLAFFGIQTQETLWTSE